MLSFLSEGHVLVLVLHSLFIIAVPRSERMATALNDSLELARLQAGSDVP